MGKKSAGGPGNRRDQFQFGLVSVILLTTLVAALCAALRLTNWPPIFRLAMGFYAFALLCYLVFRGAYVIRRLREKTSDWDAVHAERAEMERLVAEHRASKRQEQDDSSVSRREPQSD